MLPKKIIAQKKLIATALQVLDDLEVIQRLVKPINVQMYNVLAADLQALYADTVAAFIEETGVVGTFNETFKNKN